MKTKLILLSVVVSAILSGCGTTQHANTNLTANHVTASATATTLNPEIYLVCQNIYRDVSAAISENSVTKFDSELKPITDIGEKSAAGSPNKVLYEDAEIVVALDDGANGEGAPVRADDMLQKSLDKLQTDLAKYKSLANQ